MSKCRSTPNLFKPAILVSAFSCLLFLMTSSGLHAAARAWVEINHGISGVQAWALAVDGATPQTVYVGIYGYGIYRSTDGGANWIAINEGLTDNRSLSIAIDGSSPQTVYFSTEFGGVFKSTNGGTNWSQSGSGLTSNRVQIS